MRVQLVLFGWLFAFAAVVGCASGGSTGAPEEEETYGVAARDYAPLAVGASWTYETNVLGDTTKGSVLIRIVDRFEGFYRDSAGAEYRHTSGGLRDRIRYLIRNPLKPGFKWKATLSTAAVEHFTIESVGEPCETKAGSFGDCLVITAYQRRNDRETQHVTYTWVRSVGLAKILVEGEVKGRGRFKQTELSLIQYNLSGQSGAQPAPPPPAATDEEGAPAWNQ